MLEGPAGRSWGQSVGTRAPLDGKTPPQPSPPVPLDRWANTAMYQRLSPVKKMRARSFCSLPLLMTKGRMTAVMNLTEAQARVWWAGAQGRGNERFQSVCCGPRCVRTCARVSVCASVRSASSAREREKRERGEVGRNTHRLRSSRPRQHRFIFARSRRTSEELEEEEEKEATTASWEIAYGTRRWYT